MSDPVDREFRLAFWKLHILHHAAQGPIYGLWMLEELAEHGHRLSPGTLYPIFQRMEAHGWIRSDTHRGTKSRRNYRITAAGKLLLRRMRAEVKELYRELIPDRQPGARAGMRKDKKEHADASDANPSSSQPLRGARRPRPRVGPRR